MGVLEPQTACFHYGRPTRDPNSQLSPPPPFGKGNGRNKRSDGGGGDQQEPAKVNGLAGNHYMALWGSMQGTGDPTIVSRKIRK